MAHTDTKKKWILYHHQIHTLTPKNSGFGIMVSHSKIFSGFQHTGEIHQNLRGMEDLRRLRTFPVNARSAMLWTVLLKRSHCQPCERQFGTSTQWSIVKTREATHFSDEMLDTAGRKVMCAGPREELPTSAFGPTCLCHGLVCHCRQYFRWIPSEKSRGRSIPCLRSWKSWRHKHRPFSMPEFQRRHWSGVAQRVGPIHRQLTRPKIIIIPTVIPARNFQSLCRPGIVIGHVLSVLVNDCSVAGWAQSR